MPHAPFTCRVARRLESAPVKKFLAVCLLVVAACGKRGDPRAPVPAIPKATSDLLVTQRGTKVILSWSYPSLTTAGQSLRGIRRVTVYRYVEELPMPQAGLDPNAIPPGEVDTTRPRPISLFAKVPAVTPGQFNKLKQSLDSIEGANLPVVSVGAKLEYDDTPPSFHASDGRPVRLTYAVVTVGESARSDLSNLATIVPLDVPVPPAGVGAAAKPQGVVLSWTAPAATATGGEKPFIAGYNIYRAPASQPGEDVGSLQNTSPVAATTYTDTPPYGEYRYRVSAVAVATPRIESDLSAPVAATFKDLLPPPPPASVSALVETKSVRLIWEAVDAADLAGYNVYRYEGTAKLKLTPFPSTAANFVDISIDPGIEYTYAITSVDKSGNESAPTMTDKVLVPKTL
jgi:hypothetical protein